MAAAKKAAAKKAAATKAGGTRESGRDPNFANKPVSDEERKAARVRGSLARGETRGAQTPGQHPDRTHESNMVEVTEMRFTRRVDGHAYGPFGPDAPREKRMVPLALQVTFNLPLAKEKAGGSGKTLTGNETPAADEDQLSPTEEERNEAAEAAGLDQESQLAARQKAIDAKRAALINSGAIEGSAEERERLGAGHSEE